MAVKLNGAGRAHAASLIAAGKVDASSPWSFSAADGNALGDDYAKWHLGVDASEAADSKARYKYPFGKGGKVYASGLRAAASRAGAQNASAIGAAASALLAKINAKQNSEDADFVEFAAAGIQMIVGRLKGKTTTTVASILFDKKSWDVDKAKAWLKSNDFKADDLDTTANRFRFRQRDPGEFETGSMRTIAPGKQTANVALDELVAVYAQASDGISLRVGRRYDYMSIVSEAPQPGMNPDGGKPVWAAGAVEPEPEDDFSLQAIVFDRAKFTLLAAVEWLRNSAWNTWPLTWEEAPTSFTFEVTPETFFDPASLKLVDAKSYAEGAFIMEFAQAPPPDDNEPDADDPQASPAFDAAKKAVPDQVPGVIHHPALSDPSMHTFGMKGQGMVRAYAHVFKNGDMKAQIHDGGSKIKHTFVAKKKFSSLSHITNRIGGLAAKVSQIGALKKAPPAIGDNWIVTPSSNMPDMSSMAAADDDWKAYDTLHQIPNVEIFRTGKWNGDDYSDADLDAMVEAFPQVGFQVPVKLGHESASGDRAFGWIQSIRRVGDVLIADLKDVPGAVYSIIQDHGFDAVSSEIFWNLKRGGKTFRRVLKAVALLGAETPGVSGLAPLRAAVHGLPDSGFEALRTFTYHPEEWNMDKIAKLTADLAVANAKITELTAQLGAAGTDATKLAKFAEDLKAASTLVTQLTADLEAARKEVPDGGTIKQMQDQITSLTAANSALQERERKSLVEKLSNACRIPAFRTTLAHLFDLASQDDKPRVATFKEKQGDKEVEVKKTSVDLLSDLVEQLNKRTGDVFRTFSGSPGEAERLEESEVDYTDPSAEANRRAQEHMQKTGEKSFSKAVTFVLKEDPVLAQAYKAFRPGERRQ